MSEHVATLVSSARVDEAVEVALEQPTREVVEQVLRADSRDPWSSFQERWLSALPPLERLQAAVPLAAREQLLLCHAAAADTFAVELRDFWSFTDGPDAEVSPVIMDRFRTYADEVEGMSFDPHVARRERPRPAPRPASEWPVEEDHPLYEHLPVLPAAQNALMASIASGRQTEALRLSLDHREVWVKTRLDYDAVETYDEASSAFIQAWLPALPPLERLQAASWVSSNYQLALVHLPHAYGIGARLLLEALAVATTCWADLVRALGTVIAAGESPDGDFGRRLAGYADQLEAMSFDPIPAEPWF